MLIQVSLGAVNSINWARVLAQITYYFHAYFQVTNKLPGRRDKVRQWHASLVLLKGGEGWGWPAVDSSTEHCLCLCCVGMVCS